MEVSERLASNGSIGHFAGDPLFKELSELIKRSIRKLDIASRRSKRTYAFVLPEADREKTKGFIHRMKTLFVSQLSAVKPAADTVDELFHFGFAICPDDSDKLEVLIKMAEANLIGTSLRASDASLESAECREAIEGCSD
jgi:diguanylate cyclase (GGDEF)-like protein